MAVGLNKVFNIGLNRAGTTSLASALNLLGVPTLHYRHEGTRLIDRIIGNREQGRRLLAGYDEEFTGFSDFAGHYFYRELDRQYPGSKFILTVRNMDDWLASRAWKVRLNQRSGGYRYGFLQEDRAGWRAERLRYEAELAAYFTRRPDDFLRIDIPAGEGWEKLCPFLGLAPPPGSFPRSNVGASQPGAGDSADTGE